MTKEQRQHIIDKAVDLIYEDLQKTIKDHAVVYERLKAYVQGYLQASDNDAHTIAKWALYTVGETIHIYKEDI